MDDSLDQKKDPELASLIKDALPPSEIDKVSEGYYVENDIIMRKWRTHDVPTYAEWAVYHQVVLPKSYRNEVLNVAHEKPLGGHFGVRKTRKKILQQFFQPGIWKDIAEFCKTCHVCQVIGKPSHDAPPAPLHPIPVADEAFTRVIIDCVGRLPKTKSGC